MTLSSFFQSSVALCGIGLVWVGYSRPWRQVLTVLILAVAAAAAAAQLLEMMKTAAKTFLPRPVPLL